MKKIYIKSESSSLFDLRVSTSLSAGYFGNVKMKIAASEKPSIMFNIPESIMPNCFVEAIKNGLMELLSSSIVEFCCCVYIDELWWHPRDSSSISVKYVCVEALKICIRDQIQNMDIGQNKKEILEMLRLEKFGFPYYDYHYQELPKINMQERKNLYSLMEEFYSNLQKEKQKVEKKNKKNFWTFLGF